jgi:hypothetical protein
VGRREVVGERCRAGDGHSVDGRAPEGVGALGEQLFELFEWELLEGWLAALGEQFGEPEILRSTGHVDIQDRVALRVEQFHLVPRLTVEEDLQTGVTVGRVDLHLEPSIAELDGLHVGARRAEVHRGDGQDHG